MNISKTKKLPIINFHNFPTYILNFQSEYLYEKIYTFFLTLKLQSALEVIILLKTIASKFYIINICYQFENVPLKFGYSVYTNIKKNVILLCNNGSYSIRNRNNLIYLTTR